MRGYLRTALCMVAVGGLISPNVFASGRIVGNGGFVVHCGGKPPEPLPTPNPTPMPTATPDPTQPTGPTLPPQPSEGIRETKETYETLDLYEARVMRGWPIVLPEGESWSTLVEVALKRWDSKDPYRSQKYLKEAKEFFQGRAALIPNMDLSPTGDAGEVNLQKGCYLEQAAVQVKPDLPGDVEVRISKDIWDRLGEPSRAALVLHEILYKEFLQEKKEDSRAARFWVGLLLADRLEIYNTEQKYLNALHQSGLHDFSHKGLNIRYNPDDQYRRVWDYSEDDVSFDGLGRIQDVSKRNQDVWSQLAPSLRMKVVYAKFNPDTGINEFHGRARLSLENAVLNIDSEETLFTDGRQLVKVKGWAPGKFVGYSGTFVSSQFRLKEKAEARGVYLIFEEPPVSSSPAKPLVTALSWNGGQMEYRSESGEWADRFGGLVFWNREKGRFEPGVLEPGITECPAGAEKVSVGSEGGHLCRSGGKAVGPFTQSMVKLCEDKQGGDVCKSGSWNFEFAAKIRGIERCPLGAYLDDYYESCVEGDKDNNAVSFLGFLSPWGLALLEAMTSPRVKAEARFQGRFPIGTYYSLKNRLDW